MNKIITLKELPNLISKLTGDRIVLVGGCFDILHLGHIHFLKAAKKYGTVLVALESDENLRRCKGISRPIHKQAERAEMLAELSSVNFVILLPPLKIDQEYFNLVKTVSPDIICVTEGDPQLTNKTRQAKFVGAKLVPIPKINTPSTSQLVKLLQLDN